MPAFEMDVSKFLRAFDFAREFNDIFLTELNKPNYVLADMAQMCLTFPNPDIFTTFLEAHANECPDAVKTVIQAKWPQEDFKYVSGTCRFYSFSYEFDGKNYKLMISGQTDCEQGGRSPPTYKITIGCTSVSEPCGCVVS